MYYALLYVPESVNHEALDLYVPAANSAGQIFQPSNWVITAGALDFSGGPCRIRCAMKRKLNQSDRIVLLLKHSAGAQQSVGVVIEYFIKY